MVLYSHLFQNFPQFIVLHTVKGFGIVNKTEVDVFFWNSLEVETYILAFYGTKDLLIFIHQFNKSSPSLEIAQMECLNTSKCNLHVSSYNPQDDCLHYATPITVLEATW